MIKAENISYQLDGKIILDDFTFEFQKGLVYGIISPIEDRTAILLKLLCGIAEPLTGRITYDGVDILNSSEEEIMELRKIISFVFDRGGLLSNLTVLENLMLPMDYHLTSLSQDHKIDMIYYILEIFGIDKNVLNERPAKLHYQVSKLMALVRGYITNPEVILYDNPLSDLERAFRKKVIKFFLDLKHRNVTQIFYSTTDTLFEISDNNLVFYEGKLVETGPWEELIMSNHSVTQYIIKEHLEIGINEA